LLHGLFPDTDSADALIQSETYDSLEPVYNCPNANALFTQYTTDSSNWTLHLMDALPLYEKLDAVSGIPLNDTAGWHTSFDQ
jgi:acid phosphatase